MFDEVQCVNAKSWSVIWAQATGAGALFLIDEIHNLDASSLARIYIAFQAISRHSLPVAMVAAGLARPPGAPGVRRALRRSAVLLSRARPASPTQRGVSVHRDSLIQKGLIYSPRRGQLDFTVPLFAESLRDDHPLDTLEQSS